MLVFCLSKGSFHKCCLKDCLISGVTFPGLVFVYPSSTFQTLALHLSLIGGLH